MGRRELRDELESTWVVYEPRVPGVPITEKDIEDTNEREREELRRALKANTHLRYYPEREHPRRYSMRGLTARQRVHK